MKIAGLLLFLVPIVLFSQDLTGTWVGRESGVSYLRLVVVQVGDSCFGYTYDEGPGFCRANFAGKLDKEKQKLRGRGVSFIARSFDHVLGVYNLNYSKDGTDEYLDGTVGVKGVGSLIFGGGFAQLKKTTNRVDTTGFMLDKTKTNQKKERLADSLSATQKPLPVIVNKDKAIDIDSSAAPHAGINLKDKRTSKLIKTIYTNVDTIKMILYDNGVVDDDTVTVYFDNKIVLDHFRISEKAKELYLPLTKNGQPHKVELFANNLGTIPPNTALVIVMAGRERYEVYASYDLSTNAEIIFQYKE